MRTITLNWLKKHKAYKEIIIEFKKLNITDLFKILNILIKSNEKEKLEWANWLIVQIMNKRQKIQYAVFAAELVIDNYEKKRPDDNRPRKAIKAAKRYINKQSIRNKNAANNAALDVYLPTCAAYAVIDAAYAADSAATYAADNITADYNKTLIIILKNGIKLVKTNNYKTIKK